VSWLNIPQPWVLSLDRTTWELGKHYYNILTVGIVHEGVAIPLLWWMLEKKGNSNSDERMRFLEEMLKIFPDAQIRCLCADREFIGQLGYVIFSSNLLCLSESGFWLLTRSSGEGKPWPPKSFSPIW
jgi:hypothetical protein